MKTSPYALLLAAVLAAGLLVGSRAASEPQTPPPSEPVPRFEYVTIRWDGSDNTHLIRPGGQVEHIGAELRRFPRPGRTDDRSFYMNVAVNGLAKEGYEVAAMTENDILLRRQVP